MEGNQQAPPSNIIGQIMITMFNDGRPPSLQSTVDPLMSLRILGAMIMSISNNMQKAGQRPLPPVEDKIRKYLGPRENIGDGKNNDEVIGEAG